LGQFQNERYTESAKDEAPTKDLARPGAWYRLAFRLNSKRSMRVNILQGAWDRL